MAALTLPGVLATGIHASRPAASAVAKGCLYSCTTHSLVYQSDGSSWTTWATLGGSAVTDATISTSDVTTNNASTGKHGWLAKLDNNAAHYMDGTGAWSTPAGGGAGLVLLEQHTASASSSLDFTTFISSTYDDYVIEILNVIPGTANQHLLMRMGTGAGPTIDTGGNYRYILRQTGSGGSFSQDGNSATAIRVLHDVSTTSGYSASTKIRLVNPASASLYKQINFEGAAFCSDGNFYLQSGAGLYQIATAVTGLSFLFASGNIASGIIRAYGIVKS